MTVEAHVTFVPLVLVGLVTVTQKLCVVCTRGGSVKVKGLKILDPWHGAQRQIAGV